MSTIVNFLGAEWTIVPTYIFAPNSESAHPKLIQKFPSSSLGTADFHYLLNLPTLYIDSKTSLTSNLTL